MNTVEFVYSAQIVSGSQVHSKYIIYFHDSILVYYTTTYTILYTYTFYEERGGGGGWHVLSIVLITIVIVYIADYADKCSGQFTVILCI